MDKLAQTNPYAALRVARSVPHPWYRCQSLSTAAKHIKNPTLRLQILIDAFGVAQTQEEINRVVTVSAWPLEVLASIDLEEAKKWLKKLILQAEEEPHPIRRTDAIFALFWAIKGFPDLLEAVIPSMVKSLLTGHGWKIDRQIRFLVTFLMKEQIFQELIASLIAHHRENREKRHLIASLARLGATDE